MFRWSCGISVVLLCLSSGFAVDEPEFVRVPIDDNFRAEGVAVGDFNHDGRLDIGVGDYWYAAPDWKMFRVRQPLTQKHEPTDAYNGAKGYSNTFASWSYDINQDGWDDLIAVGYPGDPFYWYENPKGQPGDWPQHEIWHSACNETVLFTDLTGDGKPELVFGSQPEMQMGYAAIPPVDKCREKWVFTAISVPGNPNENGTFKYYHGLGAGDVNQDGRQDVIIPHGWWQGPAKLGDGPWEFHPVPLAKDNAGAPLRASNIHVIDLDLDGDQDFVMCSAHDFGIWWFENPGNSTDPFTYHLIDESFSQTHASALLHFTSPSSFELVTGKRYFAHMGPDPGEFQPVVMFRFEIVRKRGAPPQFIKREIEAGKDTGVGTQFAIADLDQNGSPDIILSNKKGVNVIYQKK